MIAKDQPSILGPGIIAAVSSRNDGDMKFGTITDDEVVRHRAAFLSSLGISLDQAVLVKLDYGKQSFTEYRYVGGAERGQGMRKPDVEAADALVATEPGVALFLPIADCVGAILYDPAKKVLMLSHLGRHSIEQDGAFQSIRYLKEQFDCNPVDLVAWLSPAAGKQRYPLRVFENRSMHEMVLEGLMAAGVLPEHIEVSLVDTTAREEYYSHSEFLKGHRDEDGRFAVVAMMTVQGEPA